MFPINPFNVDPVCKTVLQQCVLSYYIYLFNMNIVHEYKWKENKTKLKHKHSIKQSISLTVNWRKSITVLDI